MIFGIKSAVALRKNLIVNPFKIISDGGKATDFHENEIPNVGSSYTCLAVILIDLVLKKIKTVTCKCS